MKLTVTEYLEYPNLNLTLVDNYSYASCLNSKLY